MWGFLFLGAYFVLFVAPGNSNAQATIHFPVLSAGEASTTKTDTNAFSQPSGNMSFERRLDFSVGNSFFRNPWVKAPASTKARDGLGPLFNTNGCQNCHIKDGRGHLPLTAEDNAVSMLVRIGLRPESEQEWEVVRAHGAIPDPSYGTQIQDFANDPVLAEAQIVVEYEKSYVELFGGEKLELVKPKLRLTQLNYGPLDPRTQTSIRIASPMIGLGLLEAIPEETLAQYVDPNDKNGDGISGRFNMVRDEATDKRVVGRFGWKAEQPSLRQQNAAAFVGDIGLTSSLFPRDTCQPKQVHCSQAPNGGTPEVSDKILDKVTFYTRNLAVPRRRNVDDPAVIEGSKRFMEADCHLCHRVGMLTAKLESQPEQSEIAIFPYTDMLLHDMGEGLTDNRPAFAAQGREWRTAPLWGIGLTKVVSGHENYLHDGRARTLMEAIMWHGGEAAASRKKVREMSPESRNALVAFLKSL